MLIVSAFCIPSLLTAGDGRTLLTRFDSWLERSQRSGIDTLYQDIPQLNRQLYVGAYGYWQNYRLHMPFFLPSFFEQLPGVSKAPAYNINAHTLQAEMELGLIWKGLAIEIPIPIRNNYHQSYGIAKNGSVWGFRLRFKHLKKMDGYRRYGDPDQDFDQFINNNHAALETAGIDPAQLSRDSKYLQSTKIKNTRNTLSIFFAEGYYVLNNKRFSLSAGLYADMVQKRSAGSPLLYCNYYQSTYEVDDIFPANTDLIQTRQISLGCGYGYNLALKGGRLVIHASLVPMFSLRNTIVHEADFSSDEERNRWGNFYYALEHGQPKFRANFFARFAINYSFDRYVLSLLSNFRHYGYSNVNQLRIINQEVDTQINLGMRF